MYKKVNISVCSQNTCDPQISNLYKNTSVIRKENKLNIDRINKANLWVAGENSFLSLSYSDVLAYKMGEITPSKEDRKQTSERNSAKREFLASFNIRQFPSSVEVFTTDHCAVIQLFRRITKAARQYGDIKNYQKVVNRFVKL